MQMLQKQAVATRNTLDAAAQELTTGLKASRFEATGGNLTRLFALERSLDRNAVFTQTISLTELRLDIMQESFGQMLTPAEDLALDLTQRGRRSATYSGAMLHATHRARSAFVDAVGAAEHPGRRAVALRRHRDRQRRRWSPADAILADLDALVAGAADGGGRDRGDRRLLRQPGGGFYTSGYVGSADDLTPVDIGEGQRLDYGDARRRRSEIVALLRAPGDGRGGRRRRASPATSTEQHGAARRGRRADAGRQGGRARPAARTSASCRSASSAPRPSASPSARRSTSRAPRSSRPTRSRRRRPTSSSRCSSSRSTR